MSQDPPSPPGASFPRFHALDSVRAVVLLLGVVLHAILFGGGTAGLLGASPATSARVVDWIHSFRMPLFFLISGFFCHMMFVKHGAATYLARRW
ncbi:MAG: hypothetical protein DMD79_23845 [Candidatus Rokuibacteriota bacterium]|nr:MAG: hypothetical protein DMD79_23845 [Candidatus Rokubacteria bacterium]